QELTTEAFLEHFVPHLDETLCFVERVPTRKLTADPGARKSRFSLQREERTGKWHPCVSAITRPQPFAPEAAASSFTRSLASTSLFSSDEQALHESVVAAPTRTQALRRLPGPAGQGWKARR